MRKFLVSLILCLALLLPGCGTLIVTAGPLGRAAHPYVFGGVRCDFVLATIASPFSWPMLLIDLPFSFTADILVLPFAIIFYDDTKDPFRGMLHGGCL